MIKKVFSTLILLFFAFVPLFSQQVIWQIKEHDMADPSELEEEINNNMSTGFIPFGISIGDNRMYVLYLAGPGQKPERWELKWYRSGDEIRKGMEEELKNGFVPAGISDAGGMLFILFLKTGDNRYTWTFVPGGLTGEDTVKELTPYLEEAFLPAGITIIGEIYWTLVVRQPVEGKGACIVETYTLEGDILKEGLARNMGNGFIPRGMVFRGDKIDLLFVKM
ncbi:MAG: hypothetical protein DRP87_16795 [Spirochaetes bacterium]|nr:MAG: hypothetical protein DRP87_16795 [Spirochaetota bacterium]